MGDVTVPFRDHMTWHNGKWSGVPTPTDLEVDRKARKALDAKIKKFVNGITPERIENAWNNTMGDCFICRGMFVGGHEDHLLSHVEEDYFHAHLVKLMLTERGFNVDFALSYIYSQAQQGVVDDYFLKTPLRKFLRKHLTTGVAVAA
jgi:hypothetical protein